MADNKTLNNENNKPIYIAIDTDVIGSLATLHYYISRGYGLDSNDFDASYLKKNFKHYKAIYDGIVSGKIKPVVTETIFNEACCGLPLVTDFMKEMCYFPKKLEKEQAEEKKSKVRALAEKYVQPFIKGTKIFAAPLKKQYNAYLGKTIPSNDAFAMAEATIEGLIFVTQNERDFTKTENDFKRREHNKKLGIGHYHDRNSRKEAIISINRELNYGGYDNNKYSIPAPMGLTEFARRMNDQNFQTPVSTYEFVGYDEYIQE